MHLDFGRDHRSTVLIALALSGSDPASGKWLLTQTWSRDKLLTLSTTGSRDILFTLAMCDPATCVQAVEAALARPKTADGFSRTGIVEMLGAMTEPGREYEALGRWSNLMYAPINEDR